MSPSGPKPLPNWILRNWMRCYVTDWLTKADCGAAFNPADSNQDWEEALQLEPSGVPIWYPHRDLKSGKNLSPSQREESFLEFLGYELMNDREAVLRNPRTRRQVIARILLFTHAELPLPEIPIPEDA